MNDKELLNIIMNNKEHSDASNIRENGKCVKREVSEYIDIKDKEDKSGIDIIVKDNTKLGIIDIPVLVTKSGLQDIVYNDFYIGKNSNVIIYAGCAVCNKGKKKSSHNGIHRFFIGENSNVTYYENHYGEGVGKRVLNPTTEITLENNSSMKMNTVQIKGVDDTIRTTKANLSDNTNLVINEKILTENDQVAKTNFNVYLNGMDSKVKVSSRSIAKENSFQEFNSYVEGNNKSFGHVECDAIIMDNGKVLSRPSVYAKHIDSNLIHEANIGKIANDELIKLETMGLTEKEAEQLIIKGFLL